MADQWNVKFENGALTSDILLSASEGEQTFQVGAMRRSDVIEPMAGGGIAFKEGCELSATHVLHLLFATTTTNAAQVWALVYGRCRNAYNGVPGKLTVPDLPAFENCVVTDVQYSVQERVSQPTPLTTASSTFTDGIWVEAVITFEQGA